MTPDDAGIDEFLQAWVAELTRVLTELNGTVPNITCSRARELSSVESNGLLWWRAACDAGFSSWIGSREATWSVLGRHSQAGFGELMAKVFAGTGRTTGLTLRQGVQFDAGEFAAAAPDLHSLCYALIGIHLQDTGELPSLLFVLEPEARKVLMPMAVRTPTALSPMLQRLMDLELPLSVALGRANLPIAEVLKLTSGSIIPLKGHVGGDVELLVHGTTVARGQVVSYKGNYGVRIQQIISPMDRLNLYTEE